MRGYWGMNQDQGHLYLHRRWYSDLCSDWYIFVASKTAGNFPGLLEKYHCVVWISPKQWFLPCFQFHCSGELQNSMNFQLHLNFYAGIWNGTSECMSEEWRYMWRKVLMDKEMQNLRQTDKKKPKELIHESKEAKDKGSALKLVAILHRYAE